MSEGSGASSAGGSQSLSSSGSSAAGSLGAEVDESPLQKTMDKNKESLKVKLMMRRPINQLVAQGIMPSLKTPPAFHEQRQKLERAKTGDLLKAKIQQRPDREELVRQHILEADVGHVDPSLAERQRMLKKARLADSLNDQLSHRPGPLELIKKNILHTEEPIERAVKEGVIPFKATSEGQLRKPQHPDHYITFEDDSQSSEGAGSPSSNAPTSFGTNNSLPTLDNIASSVPSQSKSKESRGRDVLETAAASAGIVNVAVTIPTNAVVVTSPILQQIPNDKSQTLQTFAELCSSVVSPLSLGSSTSSLSPLSSIASPPTPLTPRPAQLSSPAPGKADKSRKKSKTKTQPKTRTIKFHEYKGPPNAQKNTPVSASSTETSYELLLQQQQLFLQWQLEWQHKYPQIILPAAQKPTAENISNLQNTISSITSAAANGTGTTFLVTPSPRAATPIIQPPTPQSRPPSSPPQSSSSDSQASSQNGQAATSVVPSSVSNASAVRVLTKLEDMKVSDLKMELKKRNLPVSGPKPQLIERLKPFTHTGANEGSQQQGGGASESNGRTMSLSSGDNPGSVVSEMDIAVSPSAQEEEETHFSPGGGKTCSPPPPSSPAPSAMDTSEPTPPTSPSNGDIIIQQQQRKIEELQRELQKSQQQLQQIRQGKEASANTLKNSNIQTTTTTIPVKALLQNSIIHIDPKSQQKLILQQHLQNKKQQQQLQIQLQQLQQQQQQQQQGGQQFNETVNAKANLAAFINQQQAQHQLNSLLQAANNNNGNNTNSIVSNNNNNNSSNINNNNNNNSNNTDSNSNNINNNSNSMSNDNIKNKLAGRRSIVLGQQQAAIVLNHLNLVKQKNGILGHQRTSSLPTFLGTLVQNAIAVDEKQGVKGQKGKPQGPTVKRAGSEEQTFIVTSKPPPPQYEEATKSLKQDSATSEDSTKRSKSVKSQIVDDVLEILIKNGELPPSAANDPSTPTTPGRSGNYDPDKGLIYPAATTTTTATGSAPPPPPPPPPLPQPGFSVTLPTSITLTSTGSQPPPQFNLPNTTFSSSSPFTLTTQSVNPPTYTLTQAFIPGAAASERDTIPGTPQAITFSISNPGFLNSDSSPSKSSFNYLENTEFMSTDTSDFDLNNSNDQNFHSNSLDYILSSNDNLLSSELSSSDNILPSAYGNGDINLKELGLDLETLDSMDFSQLDCKMEPIDTEMESPNSEDGSSSSATTTTTTTAAATTTTTTTNQQQQQGLTESGVGGGRASPMTTTLTSSSTTTVAATPAVTNKTADQLINNNPDLIKAEPLMEPMEMDDNWLDSLMPLSDNQTGTSQFNNSLSSSSSNGYDFLHCNDNSYDSLLGGNGGDPFELFDIHDSDFKLPSSSLSWDKVDFAT